VNIPTLSDFIASSAVDNVLKVLQGQLEEQVNLSLKNNPTDPEHLHRPFTCQHGWITARPYSIMRFKFHYSDLTFLQLCNAIEIFHGIQIQFLFMEELTKQVKTVVQLELLKLEGKECEKSARSCGVEG
jgi:hypothetical protein